jgi:hypothetical protein
VLVLYSTYERKHVAFGIQNLSNLIYNEATFLNLRGVGERGRRWGQEGEMAQTMYAHMNK